MPQSLLPGQSAIIPKLSCCRGCITSRLELILVVFQGETALYLKPEVHLLMGLGLVGQRPHLILLWSIIAISLNLTSAQSRQTTLAPLPPFIAPATTAK